MGNSWSTLASFFTEYTYFDDFTKGECKQNNVQVLRTDSSQPVVVDDNNEEVDGNAEGARPNDKKPVAEPLIEPVEAINQYRNPSAVDKFVKELSDFIGESTTIQTKYVNTKFGTGYDNLYLIKCLSADETKYEIKINKKVQYLWIVLSYYKYLVENYETAVSVIVNEEKDANLKKEIEGFQVRVKSFVNSLKTAISRIPNSSHVYTITGYNESVVNKETEAYLKKLSPGDKGKVCPIKGNCRDCLIAFVVFKQLKASLESLQGAVIWLKHHSPQ